MYNEESNTPDQSKDIVIVSDLFLMKGKKIKKLLQKETETFLVICGNFCALSLMDVMIESIMELCRCYKHIIYVPSYYEFVSGTPPDNTFEEKLNFLKLFFLREETKNVHFLYNSSVELEGLKFYGSPLWLINPYEDNSETEIHKFGNIYEKSEVLEEGKTTWTKMRQKTALKISKEHWDYISNVKGDEKSIFITPEFPIQRGPLNEGFGFVDLLKSPPLLWIRGNNEQNSELIKMVLPIKDNYVSCFLYANQCTNEKGEYFLEKKGVSILGESVKKLSFIKQKSEEYSIHQKKC